MALSCSKKFACIIQRNNIKSSWRFFRLNCFHSYTTHNKIKKHKRVCNNHDYCRVNIPKQHEKTKYLPGEKSLKVPFIIYKDLECLLKKVHFSQNNPENCYIEKKLWANLQDTHDVQYTSLMIQKADAVFIGEKI